MLKKNNAQFAIEFIVLIAFMFLIFIGFIAVITSKVLESKETEKLGIAEDVSTLIKNEVELAKAASNGYSRTFSLPDKIGGNIYTTQIIDNRELIITYLGQEHVSFLPNKVCGDTFLPSNEIDKENNIICANSNLDQTQCQNAQSAGLCDGIDDELLPGAKCCCFLRYAICGPFP